MNGKTKIFVIYHQPKTLVYSDIYQPICVGDNKDVFDKNYLRDDVGDNIANENYKYNELTAIYWIYKHIDEFKDITHIGFCHYRRFFAFNGNETAYVKKFIDNDLIDIDNDRLNELYKEYDCIIPRPSHYKSVRHHYEKMHNAVDINVLLKVIDEQFPEYKDDAESYFNGQNEYLYNMFVFDKNDFMVYAKFDFDLINAFCIESKSEITRLYLSERITGIFITHLLNSGKKGICFPVLHVRRKLIFQCIKQSIQNIKNSRDRSFLIKLKPILLCFMPRHVEQSIRRKKSS